VKGGGREKADGKKAWEFHKTVMSGIEKKVGGGETQVKKTTMRCWEKEFLSANHFWKDAHGGESGF